MRNFLIVGAILYYFSGQTYAAESSMCLNRPIRFAHYEFGLIYSSGNGGIDEDFQKELALRSGCRFEVSVQPRARSWSSINQGSLDMIGSGIQTPERDKFAWFFPYIYENNLMVLGPKVPKKVENFEQFFSNSSLTMGGVRSYRYSKEYDEFILKMQKEKRFNESTDPDALLRMFQKGRFDAFITNPILYLFYVQRLKLELPGRIEDWDATGPTPSGLVLSKASFSDAQARQWKALVKQLVDDGTVKRITVKYMGERLGAATVYKAKSAE